jgi:hypothetical protein
VPFVISATGFILLQHPVARYRRVQLKRVAFSGGVLSWILYVAVARRDGDVG